MNILNEEDSLETTNTAKRIAQVLDDRKAENIVVLDMSEASLMADYFIVATAANTRQNQALHNYLDEMMNEQDEKPLRVEGRSVGSWILVDYGDIVVHLFTEEMRRYYDLERLWKDAKQLEL